ncbi:hypothetical protein [Streptomyces sp. NPDC017991]|uniref:hypothetical protein n=1 Tax=Streptomyces sp. NPDC017991 TaxID=3365026 RepID=UPI0037A093DE
MFSDPIGTMISVVARVVMAGALGLFQSAFTDVQSEDSAASTVISGETRWIVIYLSIGSLLFASIKMALDRRGDAGQVALKGLVRVVVVSAVATTVINSFAMLMDEYSSYLLKSSIEKVLSGIDCSDAIPSMVLLIVGCLLIIAAIIQMILLWVRLGVMILLMGTLPMAAAASMTDWGTTWWRKHLGWMIAWLLYKPTVGLVMYSGATMINKAGADQINTQIAGMAMLLLSAIALPALLRLVVPATAALGGDSVGSATMSVAGGIASGAKSLAQGSASESGDEASGARGGNADAAGGRPEGSEEGRSGGGDGGGSSSGGDASGSSEGGEQSSGSGGGEQSSGGGGGGGGWLTVAQLAAQAGKGAADVAKSGVEGANREGHH